MDYEKEMPFGAFDSELMHQEINIPEGFEATIEGNKIILTRILSEDERIRKALIKAISRTHKGNKLFGTDVTREEALAWLEKQGEQKFNKYNEDDIRIKERIISIIKEIKRQPLVRLEDWDGYIAWLEKQGKQPSAIRWYDVSLIPQEMEELLVEWDSEDATWHEIAFYHADTKTFWDGTRQVENVTRWCYIIDLLEKQGQILANSCKSCKDERQPFDYENANIQQKDFAPKADIPRYSIGDVLCDKSCTMLNKESQSNFEITDIRNGMYICDKCSFPIHQQDEYELVAKRIEQKSAWSEEDEEHYNACLNYFEEIKPDSVYYKDYLWLKSLKERINV